MRYYPVFEQINMSTQEMKCEWCECHLTSIRRRAHGHSGPVKDPVDYSKFSLFLSGVTASQHLHRHTSTAVLFSF